MFKRKVQETVKDIVNPKSTKEIIEQIHNEFNGAGDILLKEANEILNGESFSTEKADLLKKVGFRNVPEVKTIEDKIEKKRISDDLVRCIQEYRFHYPKQKFITKEMVDQICKKYNLVCGEISAYKGFVPLKNLKDISEFKIKDEHCSYGVVYGRDNIIPKTHHQYLQQENSNTEVAMRLEYRRLSSRDYQIQKLNNLLICAPLKDMEVSDRQKVQGNWIINIPDPVVLHPVPEGYLILTAWGDEASDPLVVNEIQN